MQQDFLVHAPDDVVGVAVHDIEPGPAVREEFVLTRLHRTA